MQEWIVEIFVSDFILLILMVHNYNLVELMHNVYEYLMLYLRWNQDYENKIQYNYLILHNIAIKILKHIQRLT